MKNLIVFLLCFCCFECFGAAYTSTQSGNFSVGSTWVGGTAPSLGGDTWTIATGTTVTYDVNNQATTGWGASVVTGTLLMTNGYPCYLLMNGNLSGAGTWLIGGGASTAITNTLTNTPQCYIQFSNSVQCTMNGTGKIQWYGTPHLTNMWLSAAAAVGATSITVSNVPTWLNTNDILWVAPTNTTYGQGGEYYLVGSISGSTINFQGTLTGPTNFIPGFLFKTSIPTAGRVIGTQVAVIDCSVEVLELTQRTVPTFTASPTNIVIGVQLQNLGRGLLTSASCNGWSFTNNSVNGCANGGFAYINVVGCTIVSNFATGCLAGGFADSSCAVFTLFGNTVNNCDDGGLLNATTSSSVISNQINNCSVGGVGYSQSDGLFIEGNTINYGFDGGIIYNCSGCTILGNIINYTSTGGVGYTTCFGCVLAGNTVNNCINGALGNNACGSWTVANTINNGSGALFSSCYGITCFSSASTNDTLLGLANNGTASPYGFISYDCTNFLGINGSVALTNGVFLHKCTANSNGPVALAIPFALRPGAYRNVFISTQATNNVAYYATIAPGNVPPASTTLVNSGNNLGNWTNTILSYTNGNPYPILATLWLESHGGVTSNGYSTVNIGQDMVVNNH